MTDLFTLTDLVTLKPDPRITALSDKEKYALLDKAEASIAKGNGGLLITYDLSHSGRRINNRIYPVRGQKLGIKTLTEPYNKPILVHHDSARDPIGRFVGGQWIDLSNQAVGHFRNINDFLKVQDAYEADDPQRIYDVMKEFGLLANRKWPGLGVMQAQAKISDKDAVEKFLDGRYQTFSAGSGTDRHVCSVCMSDWATGDVCEHRHGRIYDGEMCVFITGRFSVNEGSVVNMPADDLSQIRSMQMSDSTANVRFADAATCLVDMGTVYTTDSIYTFVETVMPDTTAPEPEKVLDTEGSDAEEGNGTFNLADTEPDVLGRLIFDGSTEVITALSDALAGESQLEREWLIRVHDSLHSQYDYRLRYFGEDGLNEIPRDVYKLHGELHEVSTSKDFRGSYVNGSLDKYDMAGGASDKYTAPPLVSADSAEEVSIPVADAAAGNEPVVETPATPSPMVLSDEQLATLATSVAALLKEEEAPAVEENTDAAEVPAEVEVADSAPETPEVVDESQKNTSADELEAANTALVATTDKLNEVLAAFAKANKLELSDKNDDNELVFTYEEFVTIVNNTDKEPVVPVDDPSIASSDSVKKTTELGKFEQRIVDNYLELLEKDGEDVAKKYLDSKSGYLPRGFHPNNLND
jgi:hypothetical protein